MENEEEKYKVETKKSKWTDRDWIWLVSILSSIIVLMFTFRLSDNQNVTDMFSFISSSVSIVLAIVAIVIALKQDSDNRLVDYKVNELLNSINNKVDSVDKSVGQLKERDLQVLATQQMEDLSEEQTQETYTKEEVNKLLKENLNDFSDKVINKINSQNNDLNSQFIINSKRDNEIRKYLLHNPNTTISELAHVFNLSLATAERKMNKLMK